MAFHMDLGNFIRVIKKKKFSWEIRVEEKGCVNVAARDNSRHFVAVATEFMLFGLPDFSSCGWL